MVVNGIVAAATLLMVAFLFVWVFFPPLRPWFEAPKYRVLNWAKQFPEAVRPAADGRPSSDQEGSD